MDITNYKVSDIYKIILDAQDNMLSKVYISNEDTMMYFALIAVYKFLGGKSKNVKILEKSGLLEKLPTDLARRNYIKCAESYIYQGVIAIKMYKTLRSKMLASRDEIVKSATKILNTANKSNSVVITPKVADEILHDSNYNIKVFIIRLIEIYSKAILESQYVEAEKKYFYIIFDLMSII